MPANADIARRWLMIQKLRDSDNTRNPFVIHSTVWTLPDTVYFCHLNRALETSRILVQNNVSQSLQSIKAIGYPLHARFVKNILSATVAGLIHIVGLSLANDAIGPAPSFFLGS
jgi:hypothetical protein